MAADTRVPRPEPPRVVTRTRNPVLRGFHWIASIAAWIFFAWFWTIVFLRPLDRRAWATFAALLVVLAGIIAVNALWVAFNRGIYRTRGQRTRVRDVQFAAVHDRLGRPLEGADWGRLRGESWVRIDLDPRSGRKRYTGVSLAGPDPRGGAGGGARDRGLDGRP